MWDWRDDVLVPRILTDRDADESLDPQWNVFAWRYDELRRAGYPLLEAERLADAAYVDLHDACALIERGCSAERALEILL